ncbi:MAG: hypothetical protein NZO41_01340 [Candidatus Bipolaricaulota bacterium]|nr:hypothetical protein [Candidatus Bipolaricaulota bacterium]MDW8141405.1 CsgG/HfaB family protein [Candidatus Bipolaricaulota bacterium]
MQQTILLVIGALILGTLLLLVVSTSGPAELPAQTVSVFLPPAKVLEVAVLPFWRTEGRRWYWYWYSDTSIEAQLRIGLETELVNRPGVKVFSRERLDELIHEQGITAGVLEWKKAQEIARFIGVKVLVAGEIVQYDDRFKEFTAGPSLPFFPSMPMAVERRLEVSVRLQLLDVATGEVLKAKVLSASRSKTESGREPPSEKELSWPIVQELSVHMANEVTGDWMRELRYGLYKKVRSRGDGWVGINPSDTFTAADQEVILLIYIARAQRDDLVTISWKDPQGNIVESKETRYTKDRWVVQRFALQGRPEGSWTVEAQLNGVQAFAIQFNVSR